MVVVGDEQAEAPGELGTVGVPSQLQRLWVPHRMAYVSDHKQADHSDCPFCEATRHEDNSALIVHRGKTAYVLLNLFPYNSGHMLVCPYRHFASYEDATPEEVAEIGALTQAGMRAARRALNCAGFNLGMNQGEIAGAGVAAHLHQHIVPRWASDSNFFPIIAQTKAMPQLLGEVRDLIAAAWADPPDGA
ncbi:HIT domain-containing protein [Leucobacter sp. BZR 635]